MALIDRPKEYPGIDGFRLAAALLIVAIHTDPLACFGTEANLVLTRILARVGVPFFFMVTGFFVLPKTNGARPDQARRFLKKTLLLYIASTLIYLPVQWYKGVFAQPNLAGTISKDLLFEGTFYHLWYLPAVLLGVIVLLGLNRFNSAKLTAVMVSVLYLIGLFGDSYYGLAAKIPLVKGLYDPLFTLFGHTRNGLFFAPMFLFLGWMFSRYSPRFSKRFGTVGLCTSTVLLLLEGIVLHAAKLPRHDSMYVMLPLVMIFLFEKLLRIKGISWSRLRSLSMLVYIVHPWMIILVRAAAKLTHLQPLLIDQSLVHYFAVSLLSVGFALCCQWVYAWRRQQPYPKGRAWVEVDLACLEHNLRQLKSLLPADGQLMPVIKANAYGHGAVEVAACCSRNGVKSFAVATLTEGVTLRRHGVRGEILVFGYTHPNDFPLLRRYRLTQTVVDADYGCLLESYGKKITVQLKLDTGMHRLGIPYDRLDLIRQVYSNPHLQVTGVYSHLCAADSLSPADVSFTQTQISRFFYAVEQIQQLGFDPGCIHLQSSYGLLNYPDLPCTHARVGLALYGVFGGPGSIARTAVDLRPVLALKARVAAIRDIPVGEPVGYGRLFTAEHAMRVATVSIGYADGLPRNLSCGNGRVLVQGVLAPILGRICMDQLMIDVTDLPNVTIGTVVTLIGQDGDFIVPAEELAAAAGTIPNELLSRLGGRLPRVTANRARVKPNRR